MLVKLYYIFFFLYFQVNNNGILTFENKIDQYKPQSFPSKENRSIIAPFWADVNTEHVGGSVWFRETFEQDLLDRASAEIRSYFLQQRRFTASWMFIATWYNVGYYGASRDGKNKVSFYIHVVTVTKKKEEI